MSDLVVMTYAALKKNWCIMGMLLSFLAYRIGRSHVEDKWEFCIHFLQVLKLLTIGVFHLVCYPFW